MIDRLQYWKDKLAIATKVQKIALAIGASLIFIILLSFFLLSSKSSNKQLPVSNVVVTKKDIAQSSPVPLNTWKTYVNDSFSFKYPQDWKAESTRVMNNGSSVFVRPTALASGEHYPQVIIEKVPSSEISFGARKDGLSKIGFSETQSTLGQMNVSKFTNTIPFKISNNTIKDQPLYSSLMVFENGDNVYTLGYEIDKSQKGSSEEKLVNDILATFALTQSQ